MDGRRVPPIDYDLLAQRLAALAYPARLELLRLLRHPQPVSDVELRPRRLGVGENPERSASRQTVALHLDKLEDAGFVRRDTVEVEGRRQNRYQTNPRRFYEVIEELRRVQVFQAGADPESTTTLEGGGPDVPRRRGPCLVIVHGLYDGKTFSLSPETSGERGWLIGRKRDLAVSLDYDPFVSVENSLVTLRRGQYHVEDLEGSKNGTSVNWEPLAPNLPRRLATGDIVDVGRSRLLFLQG